MPATSGPIHFSHLCRFISDNTKLVHFSCLPSPPFRPGRKYKLGYCPLYKSGSTSWLYNFALLGGYTEEQIARSRRQISDISRSVTPELEFDGARQVRGRSVTPELEFDGARQVRGRSVTPELEFDGARQVRGRSVTPELEFDGARQVRGRPLMSEWTAKLPSVSGSYSGGGSRWHESQAPSNTCREAAL